MTFRIMLCTHNILFCFDDLCTFIFNNLKGKIRRSRFIFNGSSTLLTENVSLSFPGLLFYDQH